MNRSVIPNVPLSRRSFVAGGLVGLLGSRCSLARDQQQNRKAQIAITLDLEMSRMYPERDNLEWDYQKGNLNAPTKNYSLDAARLASERGGTIHFFCVGRVLEQADIRWLQEIAELGHPIGNHTYDHVNVWARKAEETQYRFTRSPWLIRGKTAHQVIQENIRMTTLAMRDRAGIEPNGFRTPGGSNAALTGREDLQQLLLDEGFTWVSSKYPAHKTNTPGEMPTPDVFASILAAHEQAQPFVYPTGLIEIPMSPISDVGAFRTGRWELNDFLKSV
ncbi:MAG: polysaccharide deacetylase family protein, partial [Planctomycetaceae bacterium]|nr:polysaccharide deacetylase family protein [Planctomycetaceae bacterium]